MAETSPAPAFPNPFAPSTRPATEETEEPDAVVGEAQAEVPLSYRLGRNFVLALALNVATTVILVERYFAPRPTVIVAALGLAAVLTSSAMLAWRNPNRAAPWAILLLALGFSRQLMNFAGGTVYGVRDASTHFVGLTWAIVEDGHIPDGFSYTVYPLHHLLWAATHHLTGIGLWSSGSLAATALSFVVVAFVVLLGRALFRGGEYLAALAFLATTNGIDPGQLYQPMSLAVAYFAGMVYLLVRNGKVPFGRVLFLVLSAALTLTHAYSAAVLGMALLVAALADALVNRRAGYLPYAAAGALFTFLYAVFVGHDLDYFLSLFGYSLGEARTDRTFVTLRSPLLVKNSVLYQVWNSLATLLVIGPAIAAWVLLLVKRRGRPDTAQLVAASLGLLFAAGFVYAFLLPFRTLSLAALVTAPFAGYALARMPRPAVAAYIPAVIVLVMTSVFAVHQFYPWDQGNSIGQPLDNEPMGGAAIAFLERNPAIPMSGRIVSSHPVLYQNHTFYGTPFSGLNNASNPGADAFLFREDSLRYGYSRTPDEGGSSAIYNSYTPYPTPEHLRLLRQLDLVGRFGGYAVYRT